MPAKVSSAASISSSTGASMPVTPKRKSKSSKKGGGFFGCRSKSAFDSLPRSARGNGAAIHRLQAQNVFAEASLKTTSRASLQSTACDTAIDSKHDSSKANPDVVFDDEDARDTLDDDEARDVLPDPASPTLQAAYPASVRANSVSGTGGKFRRSLSLKRNGSTASANLMQRAPPVSSTDFAPSTSDAGSDALQGDKINGFSSKGDMASIRQARGQHLSASAAAASSQNLFPDISEDDYINLSEVPLPPSFIPVPSLPPVSPIEVDQETPAKRINRQRQMQGGDFAMHESDSMRAVARALGDESDSQASDTNMTYRLQSGPSTSTPRLAAASPITPASIAELDMRRSDRGSEMDGDELSPLPPGAPSASGGFWDNHTDKEECAGAPAPSTKFVPFQYMTNLTRPVSIASFRSLASPHTPPRTSSRNAIQNRPSFSPLASQATFNGFPAGYFPIASTSARSAASQSPKDEENAVADTSMDYVETQLGINDTPADEFAQFAAKGKASRRTTIKKPANMNATPLTDSTNTRTDEHASSSPTSLSTSLQKKMVPGPAGNYITDTANMRWCSAMDEIKKALASTPEDNPETSEAEPGTKEQHNSYDNLESHIDELLDEAGAVLTKLGVET